MHTSSEGIGTIEYLLACVDEICFKMESKVVEDEDCYQDYDDIEESLAVDVDEVSG